MLTLEDCINFTDLSMREVNEVATHEGLPPIVALERGVTLLGEDWGRPALRQMIRDNIVTAAAHGAFNRVTDAMEVLMDAEDPASRRPRPAPARTSGLKPRPAQGTLASGANRGIWISTGTGRIKCLMQRHLQRHLGPRS